MDYERWLLSGVSIRRDALALDTGCGPGRMMLRLAPRFARIDGIDISQEVLDVAKRRCAGLAATPRLFLTDGQNVPEAATNSYDVAYSVICLQHICVYSVRFQILEGLFRALKPGGLLTFQMGYGPGHARMADYFENFVDAPGTNGVADVGVLHPGEIAGDLDQIGFMQTRVRADANRSRRYSRRLDVCSRAETWACDRPDYDEFRRVARARIRGARSR